MIKRTRNDAFRYIKDFEQRKIDAQKYFRLGDKFTTNKCFSCGSYIFTLKSNPLHFCDAEKKRIKQTVL